MATFYATTSGARGPATRTGTRNSGIHVAAQSWDGSVSTRLYQVDGQTFVSIVAGKGSTAHPSGRIVYQGPLAALLDGEA